VAGDPGIGRVKMIKKKLTMGTCKLCMQYKELVKRSHLTPRWLDEYIKGNGKSFLEIEIGNKPKIANSNMQTLTYVPDILCEECEGRIGRLENFFKTNVYLPIKSKCEKLDPEAEEIFPLNADYKKVKNFLLSLLWRHSFHPKRPINLNSHSDIIRDIIYTDKSIPGLKYPFVLVSLIHRDFFIKDYSYKLTRTFKLKHNKKYDPRYEFFFCGLIINIYLSNHQLPEIVECLNKSENSITIIKRNYEYGKRMLLGG
jgi:hypothetical protein